MAYMRLHSEVKCQCLFTSVKLCLVPNLEKRLKIWKLFLPGMCGADTHNLFSMQKFHILQAILLPVSLFMLPLLLT